MQLDSVTEMLGIANYKVTYMVRHSEHRIDLVLRRVGEKPVFAQDVEKFTIRLFTV